MKTWKELKIKLVGVLFVSFFVSGSVVYTQHPRHDMSKMPGMSNAKPKPRSKATPRKKRKAGKKRQTAKKHDMGNMPGMNMPGMAMPGMHRRKARPRRRKAFVPKSPANRNQMAAGASTTPAALKIDTSSIL